MAISQAMATSFKVRYSLTELLTLAAVHHRSLNWPCTRRQLR